VPLGEGDVSGTAKKTKVTKAPPGSKKPKRPKEPQEPKTKKPGAEDSKYKARFKANRIGGSVVFCAPETKRFMLEKLYGATDEVNTTGTVLGTLRKRGKQSYKTRRNQQMLRHISQMAFSTAKQTVTSEQEVEAMLINDRMVMSANLPASMDLIKQSIEDGKQTVEEFFQSQGAEDDPRMTAFRVKLIDRLDTPPETDDPDGSQQARALLTRLKDKKMADVFEVLELDVGAIVHGDFDTSDYLVGDSHKDKIVLLRMTGGNQPAKPDGGVMLHAEQGLLQLVVMGSSKRDEIKNSPMTICGGKRPCQGCFTALKLVRDLGYSKLEFNERPGMYWSISCETCERLLVYAEKNNLTFAGGKTAQQYHEKMKADARTPTDSHVSLNKQRDDNEDQGINSDSDSDIEEERYSSEKMYKSRGERLKNAQQRRSLCKADLESKKVDAKSAADTMQGLIEDVDSVILTVPRARKMNQVRLKAEHAKKKRKRLRKVDLEEIDTQVKKRVKLNEELEVLAREAAKARQDFERQYLEFAAQWDKEEEERKKAAQAAATAKADVVMGAETGGNV
jgi:hypothetical protein